MSKKLRFVIVLLLLTLSIQSVLGEIKLVGDEGNYTLLITNVTGKGVGGFYVEILMDSRCNVSDVDIRSKSFLIAYNILDSTLKITGAQGNVPGPVGDVILSKITLKKNIKLNLIKAEVSDVEGNILDFVNQTYLLDLEASSGQSSIMPIQTSMLNQTTTPASTSEHLPIQKHAPVSTLTHTPTQTSQSPESNSTSSFFSSQTPIVTPTSKNGHQIQSTDQERVSSNDSQTPSVFDTKQIPGFAFPTTFMALFVSICVSNLIKKIRKG